MAAVAPLSRAPGRFLRVRPSARGPCGTAMTDRRTAKDGQLLQLLQMMRMMMMGLENAWLYHHQRRAGPATEWPVEKSAPAVRQARCVQSPVTFNTTTVTLTTCGVRRFRFSPPATAGAFRIDMV